MILKNTADSPVSSSYFKEKSLGIFKWSSPKHKNLEITPAIYRQYNVKTGMHHAVARVIPQPKNHIINSAARSQLFINDSRQFG